MFLSLKISLTDKVADFLESSRMTCPVTKDGIVELVNSLSGYTEEGQLLYPKIYIIDNYGILGTLGNFEQFRIGKGSKNPETFAEGLKKMAPLAVESWNIYFKRSDDSIEYGLFKSGESIISTPAHEIIVANNQPNYSTIFIQQVGEGLIELKSWNGGNLLVSFGIEDSLVSPTESLNGFISCAVANAEEKHKE